MAGGGFGDDKGGARAHLYEYRITGYFVFACVVAAMGGSLFGYDLGVSGEYIFFLNTLFFSSQILSAYVFTSAWFGRSTLGYSSHLCHCSLPIIIVINASFLFSLCFLCFPPFPWTVKKNWLLTNGKYGEKIYINKNGLKRRIK